jgi:isoleucyl-tRNA synthetase
MSDLKYLDKKGTFTLKEWENTQEHIFTKDLANEFLRENRKPMHFNEVIEGVKERTQANETSIRIFINNKETFQYGFGIWALREWKDDFELAKSHGVVPFHVIDDNGYYTDTNYKGLEVWDNNKFIAKDLKEKGIVWKIEYIRHEYPFNPRSKQRIMYRAIPSWFFDIQGSKPLMLEQNENINWFNSLLGLTWRVMVLSSKSAI